MIEGNTKALIIIFIILKSSLLFAQAFENTDRLGVAIGASLENKNYTEPLYNRKGKTNATGYNYKAGFIKNCA